MLLTLLLQVVTIERTELTSVYIVLGGALFTSLVAGGISIWVSVNAARTATEVAVLTTKTATEVANLTTQTNRDVADIASQTAMQLNKATYKNDFYKIIMDYRLKAWKDAEKLIKVLNPQGTDGATQKPYWRYFGSGQEYKAVIDAISDFTSQAFWMGKKYNKALHDIHLALVTIANSCLVSPTASNPNPIIQIDDTKLGNIAVDNFRPIGNLLSALMWEQAQQIVSMDDVKEFLDGLKDIKKGPQSQSPAKSPGQSGGTAPGGAPL